MKSLPEAAYGELIFVVGPTAVGKTDFAVRLALETGGEIISADSMQIYRGLDLGTAKPSMAERKGVRHHMIDVVEPYENYSVAEYAVAAQAAIADILGRGKQPIICGGSGLYVHALLHELDFAKETRNEALRTALEQAAKVYGSAYLFERLLALDPDAASHVHPSNVKRVIRAIERVSGEAEAAGLRDFENTFSKKKRPGSHVLRLTAERAALYEKIEARTEVFFRAGLIGEVRGLLAAGVPADGTALQGIGYKEVVSMLRGEYNEAEALRLVKQNTRRLAKRQETWFKRYEDAEVIKIS